MINIQSGYALVVDDEPHNRDIIEKLLETSELCVMSAANGAQAMALVETVPTLTLAVVDYELPDTNGLKLIAKLRCQFPAAFLVMATMHDEGYLINEAFIAGVNLFLVKPNGFRELLRCVQTGSGKLNAQPQIVDQYGLRNYRGLARRA